MYRFTFFIIKIIAFFSLYIFPYRVMYYVKRIKDIFLSNRFALKIKSGKFGKGGKVSPNYQVIK